MDTEYLKMPHHYDPRRVYSQYGTDWQERVNFDRLRRQRLERVRAKMDKYNLGALILFDGNNIRYVTGYYPGNWKMQIFVRYCVIPRNGDPVLFETAGADLECARIDAPWLAKRLRPAIVWRWAESGEEWMARRMAESICDVLKEHGVMHELIGLDTIDETGGRALAEAGIKRVNAWPAMTEARRIKTVDELELLKQASAIGDSCFYQVHEEWLKPGVKECELAGNIMGYLASQGFQMPWEPCVASGGHTNPYRRSFSEKIIRHGDLVIVDIIGSGPSGYMIDYVRTFLVGEKPTPEQKDLYKECYESMYRAIDKLRPGNTSADVAREFPQYDDDTYETCSLIQFGHSLGLMTYEGMWITRGYSMKFPEIIEENMYFAIETYSGRPGVQQAVRLEQNLVVTKDGPQVFTLFPFEEEMLK